MKKLRLLLAFLQVPLDAAALYGAFIFAYHLRDTYILIPSENLSDLAGRLRYDPQIELIPFATFMHYVNFIVPAMVAIGAFVGLYRIVRSKWYEHTGRIFSTVTLGMVFILVLFFLKRDIFLPRSVILYSWVLGIAALLAAHALTALMLLILNRTGKTATRLAVIGHGPQAEEVIRMLSRSPYSPYELVWQGASSASMESVRAAVSEKRVEELIVVEGQDPNQLLTLREICLEHQARFRYLPFIFSQLPSSYSVTSIGDLPMIEVRPTPLEGWGRIGKRIFDIVVSSAALLILSPLLVLIAATVKVASPGPVLYPHTRIGRHKQPIRTWKFRTMRYEYSIGLASGAQERFDTLLENNPSLKKEWEENHKLRNDPRAYPFGTFLRTTSLDELPQLFNVLAGTLSMVGPRPIVNQEVEKYGDQAKILFSIKPGVTGLWQVSGRSDISYDERVRLDMSYIERWSLWWDIAILLKTAKVLLFNRGGNGAY